jgi:DNA-directed RNA polymerase subunit beta'
MAVHVPLSLEAQMEARTLMLASNNVLFPPTAIRRSCRRRTWCWVCTTRPATRSTARAKAWCSPTSRSHPRLREQGSRARIARERPYHRRSGEQGRRRRRFAPKITLETTVGRSILSEILPKGLPFSVLNKPLKKKEISRLINTAFRKCGLRETVIFADKLLQSGFRLATRAGISIAIDDMLVPPQKEKSSPTQPPR